MSDDSVLARETQSITQIHSEKSLRSPRLLPVSTCSSKLRNLALPVQYFHETHGGYPRNKFKGPEDVGPDGIWWSWIAEH